MKYAQMLKDYLKLAFHTLIHRKTRSLLTVLGIVIGITAVVGLVSLGNGLSAAVNQEFNSVGTNLIIIQPGSAGFSAPSTGSSSAKIGKHDLDLIKKIQGVESAFGIILDIGKTEYNGKVKFLYIGGLPDNIQDLGVVASQFEAVQGRMLKPGDKDKAFIGYDLANSDTTFGKKVKIGDRIVIENKTFVVVGVDKKIGNPIQDSRIIIPQDTAKVLFNEGDNLAIIYAQVGKSYNTDTIAQRIKDKIRKDRHQKEGNEDFQVQTSAQLIASFNTILNIVQAVIIGIAAISLIVGGIGIMNTMYTSVLERTKDIGILKSIGAKDSDILLLFLIESGLIGLIGGAIGIACGIGLGKLVEFIAYQALGSSLIQAQFPPYLIIGALLFSFVVGSIAGLLPARQGAKMNPVDALRYE
jgi:putative ABC transport system permease protein